MNTENKTCFMKSGTTYRVTSKESLDLHDKLPPENFIIKALMSGELILEKVEPFDLPPKLYGTTTKHTQRILQTFLARPSGTGVVLAGEKGSGKTLLARNVSIEAAKQGIPTIIINSPMHGDGFNEFIQNIEQPCIVLFDEFEKVYREDHQQKVLTLFDGVFPSKKLFMITCNNKWKISEHMKNRPGRIFYLLDFSGLDQEFIHEYCVDNLKNQKHVDMVCKLALVFDKFNFDMLKALVEEMNRYNEPASEAINLLNVKPEYNSPITYEIKLQVRGKEIKPEYLKEGNEIEAIPLVRSLEIEYKFPNPKYKANDPDSQEDEFDYEICVFNPNDIKKVDMKTGKFVLEKDKHILVLEKKKYEQMNYFKYI